MGAVAMACFTLAGIGNLIIWVIVVIAIIAIIRILVPWLASIAGLPGPLVQVINIALWAVKLREIASRLLSIRREGQNLSIESGLHDRDLRPHSFHMAYCEARAIHAFLLRCEGLTYQQIGDRLTSMEPHWGHATVNRWSAQMLVKNASRLIKRATRKTRWRVYHDHYGYYDGFDPLI
jgi:hypothetical protein